MFVETLRPLMDAGIATVLLDGNHDRHTVPSSQRTATYTAAQILGYSGEAYCVDRASELIRTKSGIQVACLEEIAFEQGWISADAARARGQALSKTAYGRAILAAVDGH